MSSIVYKVANKKPLKDWELEEALTIYPQLYQTSAECYCQSKTAGLIGGGGLSKSTVESNITKLCNIFIFCERIRKALSALDQSSQEFVRLRYWEKPTDTVHAFISDTRYKRRTYFFVKKKILKALQMHLYNDSSQTATADYKRIDNVVRLLVARDMMAAAMDEATTTLGPSINQVNYILELFLEMGLRDKQKIEELRQLLLTIPLIRAYLVAAKLKESLKKQGHTAFQPFPWLDTQEKELVTTYIRSLGKIEYRKLLIMTENQLAKLRINKSQVAYILELLLEKGVEEKEKIKDLGQAIAAMPLIRAYLMAVKIQSLLKKRGHAAVRPFPWLDTQEKKHMKTYLRSLSKNNLKKQLLLSGSQLARLRIRESGQKPKKYIRT